MKLDKIVKRTDTCKTGQNMFSNFVWNEYDHFTFGTHHAAWMESILLVYVSWSACWVRVCAKKVVYFWIKNVYVVMWHSDKLSRELFWKLCQIGALSLLQTVNLLALYQRGSFLYSKLLYSKFWKHTDTLKTKGGLQKHRKGNIKSRQKINSNILLLATTICL